MNNVFPKLMIFIEMIGLGAMYINKNRYTDKTI